MKKSFKKISANKLIIFDYSGTLSRDAVLFARPDDLMQLIESSGLKDFGIKSPSFFWEQLVNPTWHEGSTSPIGYKTVMDKRLRAILAEKAPVVLSARIADPVSAFVDSYFRHSNIDQQWKPALQMLYGNVSIATIIATDHYAEATGYIINFLHAFDIRAMAANEAFPRPGKLPFIIANSADIGVHKTDPRFWEFLKSKLNLEGIHFILIVDDFGYHEQKGDRYADRQKVDVRQSETVSVLKSVFRADIKVIPFMLKDGDVSKDERFGNLVAEASLTIKRFLLSDIKKQGAV